MTKTPLRIIACIIGLSGFGIIVAEILKKWQLIHPSLGSVWIVASILLLFACSEVTKSSYLKNSYKVSAKLTDTFTIIINIILIILSIFTVISIPLLWFGTIEELSRGGG